METYYNHSKYIIKIKSRLFHLSKNISSKLNIYFDCSSKRNFRGFDKPSWIIDSFPFSCTAMIWALVCPLLLVANPMLLSQIDETLHDMEVFHWKLKSEAPLDAQSLTLSRSLIINNCTLGFPLKMVSTIHITGCFFSCFASFPEWSHIKKYCSKSSLCLKYC